ncbi:unnamed protein product [Cunninghamella echinulata]
MVKASSILTLILGYIALVKCAPVGGNANEVGSTVGGAVDSSKTSGTGVGRVGDVNNTGDVAATPAITGES